MKKGNIMRDVISSSQFTENVIKEYKKGLGDMVLVAITPRTTPVSSATSCTGYCRGRERRSKRCPC